jgi:hypothetical protein
VWRNQEAQRLQACNGFQNQLICQNNDQSCASQRSGQEAYTKSHQDDISQGDHNIEEVQVDFQGQNYELCRQKSYINQEDQTEANHDYINSQTQKDGVDGWMNKTGTD